MALVEEVLEHLLMEQPELLDVVVAQVGMGGQ
jgi:hypothetical protein